MNYCQGGMSEKLAKAIFFQILSGVVALHKLNIIHRDLKLENIVVILLEGQQL
jgi:serine/threonine protein kinase